MDSSFRQNVSNNLECLDAFKNPGIPEPNDPLSLIYGEISFSKACDYNIQDNLVISEKTLDKCSSSKNNFCGKIKANLRNCKAWCDSNPDCNAISVNGDECNLRSHGYYTNPSIQIDSYIKDKQNNNWIVEKNTDIPDNFMDQDKNYRYLYNNLAPYENVTAGCPYYPQEYIIGKSPAFPTYKNCDLNKCRETCAKNSECSGFTFNRMNNNCTHKKNVINGEIDENYKSYICN